MQPGFLTYLVELVRQAPHSWRKGSVIMALVIATIGTVFLFIGWHFDHYPTWFFISGTAAFTLIDAWIFFPFQQWRADRQKIIRLTDELTSKLLCSFSMLDTGCVCRNIPMRDGRGGLLTVTYFRVKVEVVGNAIITGCSANLTSVVKDQIDRLKGESPGLPFSAQDQPDAVDKSIKPKVPAYLDLFALHPQKGVITFFRGHLNATVVWNRLFFDPGEYHLHIVINAANCAPCEFDATFNWTLDPDTSVLVISPRVG